MTKTLQCGNVGFVKGECSEKNKRQFRFKSVTLVFIRDAQDIGKKL